MPTPSHRVALACDATQGSSCSARIRTVGPSHRCSPLLLLVAAIVVRRRPPRCRCTMRRRTASSCRRYSSWVDDCAAGRSPRARRCPYRIPPPPLPPPPLHLRRDGGIRCPTCASTGGVTPRVPSPGSMLAFVLGGGTADGNSDSVEVLDFAMRSRGTSSPPLSSSSSMSSAEDEAYVRIRAIDDHDGWRWRTMEGRLSSPRHAFGAASCTAVVRGTNDVDDVGTTSASIYAVGGWKHGAVSCDSVERLIVR